MTYGALSRLECHRHRKTRVEESDRQCVCHRIGLVLKTPGEKGAFTGKDRSSPRLVLAPLP